MRSTMTRTEFACILIVVLATTSNPGCRKTVVASSQKSKSGTEAANEAGPACKAACANVDDERNWAVCYSCRCKAAMDGWLPSKEEISCNAAREIPVFKAKTTNRGVVLEKITSAVDECFNPPRLPDAQTEKGGCIPGSKLGQLKHGDIWVKWVCRREHVPENQTELFDPQVNYDDHGIIIHNTRTGATCFYDDTDGVTNGHNNPDIDLTSGAPERITAFTEKFYRHEGRNCIGCHDNDPFMYSPYLRGAGWENSDAYTGGKYFAIHTADEEKSHVVALAAPKAEPCTTCHRIGQGATCSTFAPDSAGITDHPGLHAWMKHSGTPDVETRWGVATAPGGELWNFPVWMPPDSGAPEGAEASSGANSGASLMAAWREEYGEAIKTIQTCCANYSAPGCVWKPLQ